jgi:magnesium transporter
MSTNQATAKNGIAKSLFLGEIVGAKVTLKGKKVGKLTDFVIVDGDLVAEVSHIYISRPMGDPPLVIPWDKVRDLKKKEIIVDIDSVDNYVADVSKSLLLLKDDIVDKKVLDMTGKEVEVVYDAKLTLRNSKLYVTDVDLSHYGLLRRIGLRWIAEFISHLGESLKERTISWKYVERLPTQISSFEGNLQLKVLKERLDEMHPVDAADVLEEMDQEQRLALFSNLDTELASETLEEIDPVVQKVILAELSDVQIAQLINKMTPGQAADVLSVLQSPRATAILKFVDPNYAGKIQNILDKHEEKILNYATLNYLHIHASDTVGRAHELYRQVARGKDVIMYFYVVDENGKLVGVADIRDVLKANDNDLMSKVMDTNLTTLKPSSTLREASAMFSRYGFRALPITDENGKILGVVPYRDMMNLKHLFLE